MLIIACLLLLPGRLLHDFYISICYIKSVDGELQVNYRLFKNDAEIALSEQEDADPEFCQHIAEYIISHFAITEDKQPLKLHLKECKNEGSGSLETISCFLVAEGHHDDSKEIAVNSTVLLDHFDDQVNMIHVMLDGTKKSFNLDRDRKTFVLSLP